MSAAVQVRVWDLPLRLFHWSLVFCVIGAFVTIKVGGGWMIWHMRFGYAILALLLFRLVWGFIGGRQARFTQFVTGPGGLIRYLKGEGSAPLGHNPLGSLSVLAMIALFFVQAVLGLYSNDDIFTEGPLAHLISKDDSDAMTGWHKFNEPILYGLVALHLLAIAFYRFGRGQRLVRAMVTGDKAVVAGPAELARLRAEASDDSAGLRLRGLVVLALCAGLVYWVVTSF